MSTKIWSSGQVRCQSKWARESIIWQSGVASLMQVPRPGAQLITECCRCNYHTLKATIVAVSACSVKGGLQMEFWS